MDLEINGLLPMDALMGVILVLSAAKLKVQRKLRTFRVAGSRAIRRRYHQAAVGPQSRVCGNTSQR